VSLNCESILLSEIDVKDGEVDVSAGEVSVLGPREIIDDDAVTSLSGRGSTVLAFF
jgi:hypothetical protein